MQEHDRVASIMEEVLVYLAAHPAAADTADGIATIWLGARAPYAEVEAALEQLVARGDLVARLLPDGQVLFLGAKEP